MPLWIPQKGVLRRQHNIGEVGVPGPGTAVTSGASSSTKGTPVQLIASTSFDAFLLKIVAAEYSLSAGASQGCLDILIGAATEEVLIANLLMGYCGFANSAVRGPKQWMFPLYIPAGSRLAAQGAGALTSTAFRVAIFIYGGDAIPPFRVGGKVTTYGIGTVPDGTAVVPGASGAEGAWTEIVASTAQDHFALVPSFQASGITGMSNRTFFVDLGEGAATEEEIGGPYIFGSDTAERIEGPSYFNDMPTFADIPAGTRLVMRASNDGTNDGTYQGAIHAVS